LDAEPGDGEEYCEEAEAGGSLAWALADSEVFDLGVVDLGGVRVFSRFGAWANAGVWRLCSEFAGEMAAILVVAVVSTTIYCGSWSEDFVDEVIPP